MAMIYLVVRRRRQVLRVPGPQITRTRMTSSEKKLATSEWNSGCALDPIHDARPVRTELSLIHISEPTRRS
eukprot:6408389-Prymnesium_polylepis.2